jgi:predicted PurR-regulated permease PerM
MGLRQKSLIRRTHHFWHAVFFAVVIAVLVMVMRGLGKVLTPVVAALILSYLVDPLVSGLEKRLGVPRWLATLFLVVVGLAVVVLLAVWLVPLITHELHIFALRLQKLPDQAIPWIERTFNTELPRSFKDLWLRLSADLRGGAGEVLGSLGGVADKVAKGTWGVLAAVGSIASTIGTLLLVPVFTFYFLPQFPQIVRGARELIPFRYRGWVDETAGEVNTTLASWIRGQLTVMALLATLYAVGLKWVAQLDMAILIGLGTGLLAFIPYVGFAIGFLAALLVCVLRKGGVDTTQLVATVGVFGVVQLIDGLLLTPRIVGQKTGIGPVGVLVALLLGGKLFGFVGVLLAVPVAAALVVLIKRGVAAYKESLFFQKGHDDVALAEAPDDPAG